jgi:hypothetical protein
MVIFMPTAVLLGKETLLRLEYGVGGRQGQSGFLGDKDRFLPLPTNQTIPSHRLATHYTDCAIPAL